MQSQASGHGVTFRERRFEGTPLETRADSESLESDTCPVQHLRIHVDGLDDAHAFMFQHRFCQSPRSRTEV